MDENELKLLPPPLRESFQKIDSEVIWIHGRWIIHGQLFSTSKERVKILNEAAGTFFYVVQRSLLNSIILGLSNLADPAESYGQSNLSLETLLNLYIEAGEKYLIEELKSTLEIYKKRCKDLKIHRNKVIAHFDRNTLLNTKSNPLPKITQKLIESALENLRKFMNIINHHYFETTFGYEHFIMEKDGDQLVVFIKMGHRYLELINEKKNLASDLENYKYNRA